MCESFYILHVNKYEFLVYRLADAETIPTSISQQDKLKLNQAQPPHLHHLSHLYHPSPACTPSLLVHQLNHGKAFLVHCHHSNPTCTPSLLMHFLNHGQALPSHVQHTKPACTSHPAQVHHIRPACTSHPAQVHHTSTPCTALPHLFHHPSPTCTAPVQVHTKPPIQVHPIQFKAVEAYSFRLMKFSPTPIQLHHPT